MRRAAIAAFVLLNGFAALMAWTLAYAEVGMGGGAGIVAMLVCAIPGSALGAWLASARRGVPARLLLSAAAAGSFGALFWFAPFEYAAMLWYLVLVTAAMLYASLRRP